MPEPEPTQTPPEGGSTGGAPEGQGAGGQPAPGASFTQEQVNEIVRKRLEREAAKFADYDAHKAAAEELKKLRQAQLSDQERSAARATELEQKLADAQSSETQLRMTIAERLIRAEVASVARDLEFADPDDAWRLADLAEVKADDELNVDRALVKKALEKLAKDKPYLLKAGGGAPRPGTPPRTGRPDGQGVKPAPAAVPVIRY